MGYANELKTHYCKQEPEVSRRTSCQARAEFQGATIPHANTGNQGQATNGTLAAGGQFTSDASKASIDNLTDA